MCGSAVKSFAGSLRKMAGMRSWLAAAMIAMVVSSAFAEDLVWTFVRDNAAPGEAPARNGAVCWKANNGSIYLFGSHMSNDMWKYDPTANEWTVAKPGRQVSYGTCGFETPTNAPDARYGAVSWTGPDGALYLFGGTNASGSFNDLWRYDIASNQWTWIKGSNGHNQPGLYARLGQATSEAVPGARYRAVSWTGADGKLYLFGGAGYAALNLAGHLNDLWRYDTATNQWTWIKGSNTLFQPGVYGTQGVAAPENTPGAREWATAWTGSDGALYLFGGDTYEHSFPNSQLNDLWRYDTAANQWTWIKGSKSTEQSGVYGTQGVAAPANTPGSRHGAVSCAGPDGTVYLFAGSSTASVADAHFNDLWRYDAAANLWTWIRGANSTDQPGVYGTQGVPALENTPGARKAGLCWIGADGTFNLFGGNGFGDSTTTTGFDNLNDLWRYAPGTNQWTWIKGSKFTNHSVVPGTPGVAAPENTPGGRSLGVTWTGLDGTLYLFGGSLWRYDLPSGQWTLLKELTGTFGTQGVPAPENSPPARNEAATWTGPDGSLYFFGGGVISGTYSESGYYLNDLWRFNVATNQWTWLKGSEFPDQHGVYGTQGVPSSGNTPAARMSAACWTGQDGALYLFGGRGAATSSFGSRNDLWRYDIATNQWTWLKGSDSTYQLGDYGTQGVPASDNEPGARIRSVSYRGPDGNLYLLGGVQNSDVYHRQYAYDDVWRYEPGTNQWTWMLGDSGPKYNPLAIKGVWWTGRDGALYQFPQGSNGSLWRYDTATNQRTMIRQENDVPYGIYGTQGVPARENTPGARYNPVFWTGLDGAFYQYGGLGYSALNDRTDLSDLWRYDVLTGPRSDLRMSVTTDDPTHLGDRLNYVIEVQNAGPDIAHGVTLRAKIPELPFISATPSKGSLVRSGATELGALIGTLDVNESATIVVTLLPAQPGEFACSARAISLENDPDNTNNADAVMAHVVVGSGPDLQGSWSAVTARQRTRRTGTTWQLRGTLTISNTGDQSAGRNSVLFFLCDDMTVPQDATPVSAFNVGQTAAGRASRRPVSINLPSGVSPQGKFLIAVLDSANSVPEANEYNNQIVFGPLQ